MQKHVASLMAVVLAMGFGNGLLAQDTPKAPAAAAVKGGQGTFKIGGAAYKLSHAVAYEAKVFDEIRINVLLSSEPIAIDKLKAALKEGKGTDDKFNTFQPQVKVTFNKEGQASFSNSYANGHSLSVSGGGLKGELTVKDGRVVGKTSLTPDADKKDAASFEAQFDLELIATVVVPDDKPKDKPNSKGKTKPRDDVPGDDDSKPKKGKATADSVSDRGAFSRQAASVSSARQPLTV